jgi:hypothetical protein
MADCRRWRFKIPNRPTVDGRERRLCGTPVGLAKPAARDSLELLGGRPFSNESLDIGINRLKAWRNAREIH